MSDQEFRLLRFFVIGVFCVVTFIILTLAVKETVQLWIKEAHKPANITLTTQTSGFKATDVLTKKEPL